MSHFKHTISYLGNISNEFMFCFDLFITCLVVLRAGCKKHFRIPEIQQNIKHESGLLGSIWGEVASQTQTQTNHKVTTNGAFRSDCCAVQWCGAVDTFGFGWFIFRPEVLVRFAQQWLTGCIGGVDASGDVTKGAFSYRLVQCPVVGAGIGRL